MSAGRETFCTLRYQFSRNWLAWSQSPHRKSGHGAGKLGDGSGVQRAEQVGTEHHLLSECGVGL